MIDINTSKKSVLPVITGVIGILLFLFAVSLFGTAPVLKLAGLSAVNSTILVITRLLYWIILLLLWLYAFKVEKQSLVIWQEKQYNFLFYVASIIGIFLVLFAGVLIISTALSFAGLNRTSARLTEIINLIRGKSWLLIFTALTAGVVEELIFRGYLLPRLAVIFKSNVAAIMVSSFLFGLLHYKYGTVVNVAGPVFIGFVFAWHYNKYRNIKIVIVCHFLWDVLALMAALKRN